MAVTLVAVCFFATAHCMAIVVDLPSCRYTTPKDRRGWRGVASRGEDPDKWYDAIGVRNGPPRNFFVQSRDERYHTVALDFINTLVSDSDAALPALEQLESRMGVRQPLLNKKLFGTWAPVMLRGELVGRLVPADAPKEISCIRTTAEQLQAPATLTIKRAGERKTKKNGYGTTDAHLDPGEQIRLTLASGDEAGRAVSEAVIGALEGNDRTDVAWQSSSSATGDDEETTAVVQPAALQLGCVSLLNEYLLIQREASGDLADIWLRCDDEPVVLVQADLYSDPTRTGRRKVAQ